ncbi:MAG: Type 1 glutamine amidotransferase-like domain-containing protein [Clostridia bacterium]|nr:Type 1 glutamine amidotransferase-like domain-containing protein [Clostridia bacterium]
MGKIVAIGGGFGGDDSWKLARFVMELSGKSRPNYLQIPTTGYDFADGSSVAVFSKMGCDVDLLYLTHAYMTEEIIRQKIENADLINVPGGNLRFVSDVWKKTGADKYLKRAFEDGKVLFGSSSGSMCWFEQGFDDCGPEDDFMFYPALGLIPYCNCPHYESAFWSEFDRHVKETPLSSIACENEAALCLIDGTYSVMVSDARRTARAWFFDASDGYKKYDLTACPEVLERL